MTLDDLPPELRQPAVAGSARGCRLPAASGASSAGNRSGTGPSSTPVKSAVAVPAAALDAGRERPRAGTAPGRRLERRVRRLRTPAAPRRPERSRRQQERRRPAARHAPEHVLQQGEETRDRLMQCCRRAAIGRSELSVTDMASRIVSSLDCIVTAAASSTWSSRSSGRSPGPSRKSPSRSSGCRGC